jgi:hypothetical protein
MDCAYSLDWLDFLSGIGDAIDTNLAGSNMKWLTRFASSQRNIDGVAKWFGGAIALLGVVIVLAILVAKVFK